MTKILLTRHGHVEGITPERFRGREPLDLTARGRAQAAALAQRIAGAWRPSYIYMSPMGRCIETAAAMVLARHAEETIALVGHDSMDRVPLLGFLDLPLSAYWRIAQDPCCLNEIDIDCGKAYIRRINETAHLDAIAHEHDTQ
jgi:broad specificity phosphatase PhoE